MTESTHVVWHPHAVERPRGCVLWFTGLSGSGKSTIANAVDRLLHQRGTATFLLDGDNVRHGLNASPAILAPIHGEEFAKRFGLGFGPQDREENVRRIAAVAELFCSAGMIALTAFVSPFRIDRHRARQHVESMGRPGDFVEVFVDTPLEECERRDPKGLYRKARAGELKEFTGIDSPYEAPERSELTLATPGKTVDELARQVIDYLERIGKLAPA